MTSFWVQVLAFAYRNAIFAKRNVFMVVEMIFWPIVTVLAVGLMGSYLKLQEQTLAFVLTGAIASGALQVTQLDVGYSLLYDLWSKSVKHTFLSPVGILPALCGAWIVGILRGGFVFAVLVGLSRVLFDFRLPGLLPTLHLLTGVFWMSFLLGILVWILILLYGQRAEISVWALSHLAMLLSGIYYPVDLLRQPFYGLARAVPLTYFLDHFRESYGFPRLFWGGAWIGWGLNAGYAVLGIFLVRSAVRYARSSGILVRLSE